MCTGYRYELLCGEKVEALCTCDCHEAEARGIHGQPHIKNMILEGDRYDQAHQISEQLDKQSGFDEDTPV